MSEQNKNKISGNRGYVKREEGPILSGKPNPGALTLEERSL
jgi:hypothetical protein